MVINQPGLCFSGRRRKKRRKGGIGEKAGTNVPFTYVTVNNLGDELTHVNFSCVLVIFYYN